MGVAVLQLHPDDNVVVCCRDIRAGEPVSASGVTMVASHAVQLGHKLAIRPLAVGDKVIKYGSAIGSITAPVAAGGWVHTHNMVSDYIGVHTREAKGGAA